MTRGRRSERALTRDRAEGQLLKRQGTVVRRRLLGEVGEAAANQQSVQIRDELTEHLGHGGVCQRAQADEAEGADRRAADVDAVQKEGVEVRVQVERRAKALDGRHRARAPTADAVASGAAVGVEALDGSDEERKDRRGQLGVVGQATAEMPGQGQNPLADSDRGQHPVDQVRGGVRHGSTTARRADAAELAAQRDKQVVSAARTADAREATLESTTPEVALQRAADEHGEPVCVRRAVQEGREPAREQPIQVGLLRPTTGVSRREGRRHNGLALSQQRCQHTQLVFSSTSLWCWGLSCVTTGHSSTDQIGPHGPAWPLGLTVRGEGTWASPHIIDGLGRAKRRAVECHEQAEREATIGTKM